VPVGRWLATRGIWDRTPTSASSAWHLKAVEHPRSPLTPTKGHPDFPDALLLYYKRTREYPTF